MSASDRVLQGGTLPPRLRDLPEPPDAVHLWGRLPVGASVAIVGTRRPTPEAVLFTRELAANLATAGVVVLSGGALGIDSAAHQGALAAGGATVVVAPSGFDCPYPGENAELFRNVVNSGGGYLSSEAAAREPASLPRFFERNALMVALAHAVVLVEAGYRSGARNSAKVARQLQRPLFVVPSAPWNLRGVGCILELQLGARPLLQHREVLRTLREQRHHFLETLDADSEVQLSLSGVEP